MESGMESLQTRLGYRFTNRELLQEALTHKSFSNEQSGDTAACNERLEFLGDAVLDLVVSEVAFAGYPELPEGELTRIRAELVSEKNLATLARDLEVGPALRLGRGERRSGGADKDSLLADSLEALFGAIFCDSDYATVRAVIVPLFGDAIDSAARREYALDYKTRLQEICQQRHGRPPEYRLVDATGPDHQKQYEVAVLLAGEAVAHGSGRSKKAAEQQAARAAYRQLQGRA